MRGVGARGASGKVDAQPAPARRRPNLTMDSSGYERRAVWQSSQDEDGGVKWSYQPHRVTNIFFNDTDFKNNPLFGLMNITVDLVNERKIPQRKAIREVLYNGSNTLDQVRERLRSDPKYWTYNGLRSAFFVG